MSISRLYKCDGLEYTKGPADRLCRHSNFFVMKPNAGLELSRAEIADIIRDNWVTYKSWMCYNKKDGFVAAMMLAYNVESTKFNEFRDKVHWQFGYFPKKNRELDLQARENEDTRKEVTFSIVLVGKNRTTLEVTTAEAQAHLATMPAARPRGQKWPEGPKSRQGKHGRAHFPLSPLPSNALHGTTEDHDVSDAIGDDICDGVEDVVEDEDDLSSDDGEQVPPRPLGNRNASGAPRCRFKALSRSLEMGRFSSKLDPFSPSLTAAVSTVFSSCSSSSKRGSAVSEPFSPSLAPVPSSAVLSSPPESDLFISANRPGPNKYQRGLARQVADWGRKSKPLAVSFPAPTFSPEGKDDSRTPFDSCGSNDTSITGDTSITSDWRLSSFGVGKNAGMGLDTQDFAEILRDNWIAYKSWRCSNKQDGFVAALMIAYGVLTVNFNDFRDSVHWCIGYFPKYNPDLHREAMAFVNTSNEVTFFIKLLHKHEAPVKVTSAAALAHLTTLPPARRRGSKRPCRNRERKPESPVDAATSDNDDNDKDEGNEDTRTTKSVSKLVNSRNASGLQRWRSPALAAATAPILSSSFTSRPGSPRVALPVLALPILDDPVKAVPHFPVQAAENDDDCVMIPWTNVEAVQPMQPVKSFPNLLLSSTAAAAEVAIARQEFLWLKDMPPYDGVSPCLGGCGTRDYVAAHYDVLRALCVRCMSAANSNGAFKMSLWTKAMSLKS